MSESDNTLALAGIQLRGCPRALGVYSGFDGEKVFSGVIRCGSWTCPFCGPIKVKQLRKRLLEGDISKQAVPRYGFKFATLTFGGVDIRSKFLVYKPAVACCFPSVEQSREAWGQNRFQPQTTSYYNSKLGQTITGPLYNLTAMYEFMMSGFNKLRTALVKHFGKFMYFRIFEPHQDGVPHLHVLFVGEAVVHKSFLSVMSGLWKKYGLGFVKLSVIRDKRGKKVANFHGAQHAINYMLKYITKDIKKAGRYKRVFSCSRNTLLPKIKKEWESMKIIMGTIEDEGKCFVEEVVYDSDIHGNPAHEFEVGCFGSRRELENYERSQGILAFDGDFFIDTPSVVDSIQNVHISQLTQNTINLNRRHYK